MLPTRPAAPIPPRPKVPGALLACGCAFAVLLAALGGCAEPRTQVDCDQLLNKEKYNDVLKKCDNPYQRASAYLGKAGFNTFDLIESTAPAGKVGRLLGLTAANVNEKRLLINKAIEEVKAPNGGNQAFALLIASFLGLAVTTEQFLDNGIVDNAGTVDPAKVLDDILEDTETAGAMGFDSGGTLPNMTIYPSAAPQYIAVVSSGVPYTLDCSADLAVLACDSDPATKVYDDSLGSGIVLPAAAESANKSAVITGFGSYSSAGFVMQLGDFTLGTLGAVTQDPVASFLSHTTTDGTFDIGLSGYFDHLRTADAELAKSAGSTGGTDITAQIDAIVTKFDNGVDCAATNPGVALFAPILNEFYAVYRQAPGTGAQPISGTPGAGAFSASSLVPRTELQTFTEPLLILTYTAAYFPANLAFTLDRYKFLYPTVAGLGAFDTTQATPRVDQADPTFAARFGQIPLLAPAAAGADDGDVTFMEVLCAGD